MFSEEELRRIAKAVWGTQLQLELSDSFEDDEDELDYFSFAEENTLTASIQVTGDWRGAVLFNASHSLARRAAAIMFDLPEAHVEANHVSDALGELVSMTAGNLVALLSGNHQLSLPIVVEGTFANIRMLQADLLQEVELLFDGEALVISVMQARSGAGPKIKVPPRPSG
jgi:CheY-specific phosphatase CheX